jgi:hypothetical protein
MHQTEIFLMKQIEKYKAQVERVRELHKPIYEYCAVCFTGEFSTLYPCPTIQVLDGEQ